jgi:small-conductance mechanosensitive channel
MNFLPAGTVVWFVTIVTMSLSSAWLVYDIVNLLRLRNADRRDPLVRDKLFGYVIGVVTAVVGIVGVLRYHL